MMGCGLMHLGITDLRRRQHPLRRRAARRADAEHAAAAGVDVDLKKSSPRGKWERVAGQVVCCAGRRAWGVGRVGWGSWRRGYIWLSVLLPVRHRN